MIDVYSWPTPNGHKVHIMLEECGLRLGRDWLAHPINIGQGDQFKPEFLKISPNNKIPALVDPHGPDGKPISLNRALFFCTSPRKQASSCPRATAPSLKCCNG